MNRIYIPNLQKQILRSLILNTTNYKKSSETIYLIHKNTNYNIILTSVTILPADIINLICSYSHDIINIKIQFTNSRFGDSYLNVVQKNVFDFVFHIKQYNTKTTFNTYIRNINYNIFKEQAININKTPYTNELLQEVISDMIKSTDEQQTWLYDDDEVCNFYEFSHRISGVYRNDVIYAFNHININNFFNSYMEKYYNKYNYLSTTPKSQVSYHKNNIFSCQLSLETYNNEKLLMFIQPNNHKILKRIIIIIKIIQQALLKKLKSSVY